MVMVAYKTGNSRWDEDVIVPYEQALSGQGALVLSYICEQVHLAITPHAKGRYGKKVYSTKRENGICNMDVVKAVLLRAGLRQSLRLSGYLYGMHSSLAHLLLVTKSPALLEVVCDFVTDGANECGAALAQRQRIAASLLQAFIDLHPPSSNASDYVDQAYQKYLEWGNIQSNELLQGGYNSRFAKAYQAGNVKLVAHYLNHMRPVELSNVRKLYPVSCLHTNAPMKNVIMSKVNVLVELEAAMRTGQRNLDHIHCMLPQEKVFVDEWSSYLEQYLTNYVDLLQKKESSLQIQNLYLTKRSEALTFRHSGNIRNDYNGTFCGQEMLSGDATALKICMILPPFLAIVLLYFVPMMIVRAIQKSGVDKQLDANKANISDLDSKLIQCIGQSAVVPAALASSVSARKASVLGTFTAEHADAVINRAGNARAVNVRG
jgi:hypothetical protein